MKVNIGTNEFRLNVKKMIGRRVKTPEDQEDITQDVFLKIVKYARTDEPASFYSWLKLTVSSSIADFYRKNGKKSELPAVNENVAAEEEFKRDLTCCIDPFLKKMDPTDAELIQEIDIKGRAQLDVAETLNVNYSTLKSRLKKSRQILQQQIILCCPPDSDECSSC